MGDEALSIDGEDAGRALRWTLEHWYRPLTAAAVADGAGVDAAVAGEALAPPDGRRSGVAAVRIRLVYAGLTSRARS